MRLLICILMLVSLSCLSLFAEKKQTELEKYSIALIGYVQDEESPEDYQVIQNKLVEDRRIMEKSNPDNSVDANLVSSICAEVEKCPYTKTLSLTKKMVIVWYIYNHPKHYMNSPFMANVEAKKYKEAASYLESEVVKTFWLGKQNK